MKTIKTMTKAQLIKAGWVENEKAHDQWLTIGKDEASDYRRKDFDYNISRGQEHLLGAKLEVDDVNVEDKNILVKAKSFDGFGYIKLPHIYFQNFKLEDWRKVEYEDAPLVGYREDSVLFDRNTFKTNDRDRRCSADEMLDYIKWAAACLGYKVLKK